MMIEKEGSLVKMLSNQMTKNSSLSEAHRQREKQVMVPVKYKFIKMEFVFHFPVDHEYKGLLIQTNHNNPVVSSHYSEVSFTDRNLGSNTVRFTFI